jgi:cobalamin biosynthesis protein CobT
MENQLLRRENMVPAKLRYEIRRMFENSGTEEFNINRKQGSLNINALANIGHSDRLFKRRSEVAGTDSAVTVVIDCSGSMDGDRMQNAVEVCYALLLTLGQAGVSTSVVTFSGVVSVLKPWSMPYQKAKPLLERLNANGGTNDYAALNFAHGMLYRRPEARKVCFVLTDGEGDPEATRLQCESGARLGVTTIGIGIQQDVTQVYPNAVQIDNLADMGTVAFTKLKLAA